MNWNARTFFYGAVMTVGLLMADGLVAAEPDIVLTRKRDDLGFLKPIPVSISGFTGEAATVLKNDLLFMGITNASLAEAMYLVSGSSAGRVEGFLTEKTTKRQILGKAYTGGNTRSQIHAFADEIALALTGLPGLAQTKIAFKAEAGPGRSEVYMADYDAQNPVAVTRDGSIVSAPCWMGRGSLVYSSYKLGNPYIFAHVLNSGERRAVARHPGDNYSPAVSPDGRRVAMILNKGGSPDLYVANSDGSGLKQLTTTREAESSPCWSPDNQTLCYVSRNRGPASLFLISAAGGTPRQLQTIGAPSPTEPDWSPDGKWIAFTSLTGGFQIYIVRATGGDVIGPLAQGEDPSWAPNSRALIFCTGRDHRKTLSLLDVPTKQVKAVARILESNSQPSWAK